MVGQQLDRDLEEVDYLDLFQLDFRPGYSTETELVTFVDDQDRDDTSSLCYLISKLHLPIFIAD